jgi:hypothetical protein
VLSCFLAEISSVNNVYLVYGISETYMTAVYLVLHGREIY